MILQIDRIDKNYESIEIEYNKSGKLEFLSQKNLSNWGDTEYALNLTEVSQITFRIVKLNVLSNYYILLQQQGLDFGTPSVFTRNKKLVEIVTICLVIVIIFLVLSILSFALCRKTKSCFKGKKVKYEVKLKKVSLNNYQNNDYVMSNMASGPFNILPRHYNFSMCIICLECFLPDDECHLTTECLHLFHSHCLKRWYNLISKTSKLRCPHWNTPNTSRKLSIDYQNDIVSSSIDINSYRYYEGEKSKYDLD